MSNDLISIIVPVYNVEKYLEKCLDSVINQMYKNLEIILVDDGSTDKSGKICDKYAKIDKRIKIYHKKNGGVSHSRNYGIKKSTGKYLTFVDSDDWIEENCILDLYNIMIKNDVNIVQGLFDSSKINEEIIFIKDFEILKRSILNYKIDKRLSSLRCACGKLFNTQIIKKNKIFFPENIYLLEDGIFVYKYLDCVREITILNKKIYNYRQVSNSASHRYNKDQLKQYENVIKILKKITNDDYFVNYTIFEFLMTYISRSSKFYKNKNKFIIELKKTLEDKMYKNCIDNIELKYMNIKQIITFCLLKYKLYSIIYYICLVK